MPMGIVSDKDFEQEVQRATVVVPRPPGRQNTPQTPESLRKIIGENAIEEGNEATKAMTRALGISDSSLSAYKNGATSTASYNEGNKELRQHVDAARQRVISKARKRLLLSLNAITPEKLKDEKPRDLAGIAKDMSAIIKNMEPEGEKDKTERALIIFAPRIVTEERFEVIDAQAVEN